MSPDALSVADLQAASGISEMSPNLPEGWAWATLGEILPLEYGKAFEARWRSHSGTPPATRVVVADGNMAADEAYGLACQGTALLWRGDFQEARQMLNALARQKRDETSPADYYALEGAGQSGH